MARGRNGRATLLTGFCADESAGECWLSSHCGMQGGGAGGGGGGAKASDQPGVAERDVI